MADDNSRDARPTDNDEILLDQLSGDQQSALLEDEELHDALSSEIDGDERTALTAAHQGSNETSIPGESDAAPNTSTDAERLGTSSGSADQQSGAADHTLSDAVPNNAADVPQDSVGPEISTSAIDGAPAASARSGRSSNGASASTTNQDQTAASDFVGNVGEESLATSASFGFGGPGGDPDDDQGGGGSFGPNDGNGTGGTPPPAPVNDGPTTADAAASGAEDAASISVTITGSDIDGTVDSFSLSSLPTDGTLYTDAGLTTVAATGIDYAAASNSLTLYFVPNADFNGDVTFDYAATDDDGAVDATPATATITVTDVNDGPTTADAAASGAEDAASISVTITGSDIDGTVDSFSLSSLPTDGTLYTDAGLTTVAATGTDYAASGGSLTLYFVPNADFNGDVTFNYAATDDDGAVDATTATATITVTDVNDGPTTADAAASGAEDAASISVTITGSDIDGTVDSFSLSSLPTDGTLYTDAGLTTVAATGTDYAASGSSLTLYFVPDADFNGDVTFDYAATDDDGTVDATPATATITVTDVNDGPTTADAAASGAEDAASISVTITGSDIDGTVDSFSLSSLPTDGTLYTDAGLTTVAATGTDYAAAGGSLTLYFAPNADFNGDVTFDYAATDDDGTVDATPATATITVTDVNDGPTTANAAASGAEDSASISVTITGSDVDGTVDSFSLSSLPTDGMLYTDAGLTTLAATGTDYAAAAGSLTLYFVPDANYYGNNVTFDYAAKDDNGTVDATPATATITVTDVNDGPTTADAAASGAEDAASISVTITGSDIDGTVDSFSLSSLPTDGTLYTDAGLTTVAATGTDYAAAAGSLTLYFVPDANYYGNNVTFDYAATDDDGAVDATTATATITVTDVNDGPTTADAAASGAEDSASISVTITGSDVDGTVDSFSLSSLPTDGTLYTDAGLTTVAATGTDYAAAAGSLTLYFVPDANYYGNNVTFDYAAKDDNGAVDATPATATITVTDVNDGPTTADAAASGAEDAASISVTITGSDIDGTVDSFSLSSLPTDGTLYTDASLMTTADTGIDYTAAGGSLTLYFVPDADFNGDVTFDFAAKDDDGAADTATATITVTEVVDTLTGTPQDDLLVGTAGDDVINGLAGNDTIIGNAGDDIIDGGNHDDSIDGGAGDDTINGGNHDDFIAGGAGNDSIDGGNHADTIDGGTGDDTIDGGKHDDVLSGGQGDDVLNGGLHDDTFLVSEDDLGGGVWTDIVDGGAGDNDVIDLSNVTQSWTLDVTGEGPGYEAVSSDPASEYTNGGEFSGTITFDDGSTVVFDNIEKVDW